MTANVRTFLTAMSLFGLLASASAAAAGDADLIRRGQYLAGAADCAACHTVKASQPFAGGLKMMTPLGAIYSTNITPDKTDGIGAYSEADFARALREGVARDGRNLYPAMPYPSFAKIDDADMHALFAYFSRGVTPIAQPNRPSTIPWPMSMTWPLKIWNAAFTKQGSYKQDPAKDAEWNRGAYLVQSLGHCGACHTARGVGMQEQAYDGSKASYLGGAVIDHWFASNLTGDPVAGLGRWSEADIETFLKTGSNRFGTAYGSMTSVINHSTQHLSDGDRHAIAHYLKSLPAYGAAKATYTPLAADAMTSGVAKTSTVGAPVDVGDATKGMQVYRNFCMACHAVNGAGHPPFIAPLAGNPTVLEDDPLSIVHVTLNGAEDVVLDGVHAPYPMPAQGKALSDQEIADVLTYVRSSWGNHAAPVSAKQVAAIRKVGDAKN